MLLHCLFNNTYLKSSISLLKHKVGHTLKHMMEEHTLHQLIFKRINNMHQDTHGTQTCRKAMPTSIITPLVLLIEKQCQHAYDHPSQFIQEHIINMPLIQELYQQELENPLVVLIAQLQEENERYSYLRKVGKIRSGLGLFYPPHCFLCGLRVGACPPAFKQTNISLASLLKILSNEMNLT